VGGDDELVDTAPPDVARRIDQADRTMTIYEELRHG
jgi:hypothetical protein